MTRLLIAPALLALIALPDHLWVFAIFAAAVAAAMVQTVRVWSLRKRLARVTALAAEAHKTATKAVNQAESFRKTAEKLADECKATQAANEILCAELACSDQIIHALQNDRLAAQMADSDAETEAASDADVIPLPVEHNVIALRGEPADLAALDAEATEFTWPAIAREAFPVREWGEEAEK